MSAIRVRDCYKGIGVYSPADQSCPIDLSDNTNLWGAPPSATRAIGSLGDANISRYPQPYSWKLREKLAEYAGVDAEMIVVGCGSDDVIDSAMRAFAEPDETVCFADPTFSMVPVFALTNGLRPLPVPFRDGFALDAERMIATKSAITYLCGPNNPTGTKIARQDAERICQNASGVVIIDEAYAEFSDGDYLDLFGSGRVIVTRTLSKAFGMAGLRVGYGIGPRDLVREVEKARGPYKVSSAAEAAAAAAVTDDIEWVRARVTEVKSNRERFSQSLTSLGYSPIPSSANFILIPVPNCADAAGRLRRQGVAVRAFAGLTGIGDALRITIGPWEMMERCLDALAVRE